MSNYLKKCHGNTLFTGPNILICADINPLKFFSATYANSADPDQPSRTWNLIRVSMVCLLNFLLLIEQKIKIPENIPLTEMNRPN